MGKAAPKKWSKGKVQDKLNNAVCFTPSKYEEAKKFCSRSSIITISTLSGNAKISGSLARAMINEMHQAGVIEQIERHNTQWIYRAVKEEEPKTEEKKE